MNCWLCFLPATVKMKLPKINNKQRRQVLVFSLIIFFVSVTFLPVYLFKARAGTFTARKLTISDSRAAATSVTYDFAFTTSVTTSIKQVDIQVCDSASGTCNAPSGFASGTPTLGSDNLAGTGRTTTAPTANAFRVVVTSPSTQSTQAVTMSFTGVTNPSTIDTTYYARITTYSDTGSTVIDGTDAVAFAILTTTSIAVSATVDPTLTFSVAAVTSGGSVNSATTNVTTTATTVPFGTLSSGSTKIGAHDITITTNATSGYTTTVKGTTNPVLVSGSNNIDEFTGTNATPTTWSSPAGSANSVNTGYFGYTTNDATLGTGTAARFTTGAPKWSGTTTSPLEVAYSATGVTSEVTRVGWQAEVNALQAAGAYTGTVILVTTPTY